MRVTDDKMPKKFSGENSKAAAARARKTTAKEAEVAKKQKEAEEAYWKDDDKQAQKKQQRKEEQEKKRQQQLEKKQVAKMLFEQEMATASTSGKGGKSAPPPKLTRAQIEMVKAAKPSPKKEAVQTHLTMPLEENINRIDVEGEEARSVTEAIAVLRYYCSLFRLFFDKGRSTGTQCGSYSPCWTVFRV